MPVHTVYMGRNAKKPIFRRTYIRQWREYRGLTLERLAELVGKKIGGFTHASLSRIERGLQPYSQAVLEAIAEALKTDTWSLLNRDPADSEEIWSIWEHANPDERQMIVDLAKTVTKTGR